MNYQNQNQLTCAFDVVLDIKKFYNNPANAPLIFEATISVIQIESMGNKATQLMNQTITLLIRIWNEYRTPYFIEQILNLLVQIMPHPTQALRSQRISDIEYSTLLTDLSIKMLQHDKTDINKNENKYNSQTIFKIFIDALHVYELPQSNYCDENDESSDSSCEICFLCDCCYDDCEDFSSDNCDECGLNNNACQCVETIIALLQQKTIE
jgi:hypothetical protein